MSKNDFIKMYCFGCGAELQNSDPEKIGYIPKYLESDSQYLCQRCFRLQHYGINKEEPIFDKDFTKIINQARHERSLIVYVVDLFAFECSIVHSLIEQIKSSRVLIVASKRDVIPTSVKDEKLKKFIKKRFNDLGIDPLDIIISSSVKNYNIEEIKDKCNILRKKRNVYIFGATSVGKSTLVNAFFKIYSNKTDKLISTSPYPGTTLDVIKVPIDEQTYIYDTPGISLNTSIYSNIDKKLIKYITPNKEIKPRVYQLQKNQSLMIENIAKFDFKDNEKTNLTIYLSNYLTITRSKLENSEKTFNNMIINKQFKLMDRNIKSLSNLVAHDITLPIGQCDIVIVGLMWVKINGKGENIRVYAPKNVEVNIRECKI